MIRKAVMSDASAIQALVNGFAKEGQMLMLSKNDIYERIFEYFVYESETGIIGVCALHPMWIDLAEIRSLAVDTTLQRGGIGAQLVRAQLERAKEMKFDKVFTLTYKQAFFEKLGFYVISKEHLPKKIWTDCLKCVKYPDCDEIAMELIL